MPCNCDHYKDTPFEQQHREAAKVHVMLMELEGEDVERVHAKLLKKSKGNSTADKLSMHEVEQLCYDLKTKGGVKYTAQLVAENPSCPKAMKVHAWCVEHQAWDTRREREEAATKAMAAVRSHNEEVYRRMAERLRDQNEAVAQAAQRQ